MFNWSVSLTLYIKILRNKWSGLFWQQEDAIFVDVHTVCTPRRSESQYPKSLLQPLALLNRNSYILNSVVIFGILCFYYFNDSMLTLPSDQTKLSHLIQKVSTTPCGFGTVLNICNSSWSRKLLLLRHTVCVACARVRWHFRGDPVECLYPSNSACTFY